MPDGNAATMVGYWKKLIVVDFGVGFFSLHLNAPQV